MIIIVKLLHILLNTLGYKEMARARFSWTFAGYTVMVLLLLNSLIMIIGTDDIVSDYNSPMFCMERKLMFAHAQN